VPASLRLPLTSIQRLLAASLKHPPTPSPPSTRPLFLLLFTPASSVSLAIGFSSDSRGSFFFFSVFSSSRFGCSSGRRCQQLPSLKPQRPAARLVPAARRPQTPEFGQSKTFAHGLAHTPFSHRKPRRRHKHSPLPQRLAFLSTSHKRSSRFCRRYIRQILPRVSTTIAGDATSAPRANEAQPSFQSSFFTIALFPPRERFWPSSHRFQRPISRHRREPIAFSPLQCDLTSAPLYPRNGCVIHAFGLYMDDIEYSNPPL
jgi:hypothetical protein